MTYASEVLADSPLLYWRLDETSGTNADDATANNRDGTYTGGCTLGQPGLVTNGTSVLLNGTSGYIASSYNPFTSGSSRTYEIWLKRATNTTEDTVFSSAGGGGIRLRLPINDTNVAWYPNSADVPKVWAGAITTNAVTHLVLLFNDSAHTAELYINGVSQGQLTGAVPMVSGNNVVVGQIGTSSGDFFNGTVDEFAIYSGLLSGARILAHYNAGIAGVAQALTGQADQSFGATATLTAAVTLAGSASVAAGTSAAADVVVGLTGFAGTVFGTSGQLVAGIPLDGVATVTLGGSGDVALSRPLDGSTGAALAASGVAGVSVTLAGSAAATFGLGASFVGNIDLVGSTSATFSVDASPVTVARGLSGAANLTFGVVPAAMSVLRGLGGETSMTLTTSDATPSTRKLISLDFDGVLTGTGEFEQSGTAAQRFEGAATDVSVFEGV